MSRPQAIMIPAQVSVRGLAEAISRPVADIQAALRSRDEPDAPDDFVGATLAAEIASALGRRVRVETRDMALERLYEREAAGAPSEAVEGRAGRMLAGVVADLDDLDSAIASVSRGWSVARMPVIDRNILRLGLFELINSSGTPTAVIISEAVRLARTYSTERSAAFVHGVLASLAREVRS